MVRTDDYELQTTEFAGAVARFRGLKSFWKSFLGLTPQALCCRLLRRLRIYHGVFISEL